MNLRWTSGAVALLLAACTSDETGRGGAALSDEILQILAKERYRGAVWDLRVLDAASGEVLLDLAPEQPLYIGSVRKVFSVGALLEEIGPSHSYDTPVHRQGTVGADGTLQGNLVLVASGDLTMGGRTNPDGSIAVADYDHNEANSLGNALLTAPDPLAGYESLARQVAAAGITHVAGDVVIDDRLFAPFDFRGEFDVRPIFVNDDVVDVSLSPGTVGTPLPVVWRPASQALAIDDQATASAAGTPFTIEVVPEEPACIGVAACRATVTGQLPADFAPPLTGAYPLVRTVRITQPANYARTVFIEALEAAGVEVDAPTVAPNPVALLPDAYGDDTKVAELVGMPYGEDARLVLKVSYNIGADTSLVLWGLTQGVRDMESALRVERERLVARGIPGDSFHFVDGSGGGETRATSAAVTQMLAELAAGPAADAFVRALPVLGVDGSLAFVTAFEGDPALAGAKGRVHAKTGTYLTGSDAGLLLRGQALGGYVDARSGRRLVFQLVVNDVAVSSLDDVLEVFQDQGTIAAALWRDY